MNPKLSLFRIWLAVLLLCSTDALSADEAKEEPGTVLWKFETADQIKSSPAIGPIGDVYVGSMDHKDTFRIRSKGNPFHR